MTETTVVNLGTGAPFDVRIDRRTLYGNRYLIGRDGNRSLVIHRHMQDWRTMLDEPSQRSQVIACLQYMKGKRLGCHCFPLACHGDNYVKLIAEFCP